MDTVRATYPEHEHERFIAHFRGLTGLWVADETTRLSARPHSIGGHSVFSQNLSTTRFLCSSFRKRSRPKN